MLSELPTLSTHPGQKGGSEGEKHRFSIERLPNKDVMIVQRDHGPRIEIPMKVLAQGKTIAEAYEELSNVR